MPSINITYVLPDGERRVVQAEIGLTVMSVGVRALIPGIVASCRGNCSCVTCHVYVDEYWSRKLQPKSEMEESMLDFAINANAQSRLGCQIPISPELAGLEVLVPCSQRAIGV